MMSKHKNKKDIPTKYNPHLPNEAHRAAQWAGGTVTRNRKTYRRKLKHKGLPLEANTSTQRVLY